MRLDVYPLDVPAGVAVGVALRVADYQDKMIQAAGVTGTIVLEGTIDGTSWVVLTALVANGLTAVTQPVVAVRCNRTGAGAGTIYLAGRGRSSE
jgi:hypothetical protein